MAAAIRSKVSPGRDPAVEKEELTSLRFRIAGSLEALFWARAEIIWIKSQLILCRIAIVF
jgi:hypothetical protein